MEESKSPLHAMPLETLRARAREADRLIEQARAIVHKTFARERSPDHGSSHQVGALLDAVERLLPGIGVTAAQLGDHASGPRPSSRSSERPERETIVRTMAERIASLLADIERARSTAFPRTSSSVASLRSPFSRRE
jgi:hypothetical protein